MKLAELVIQLSANTASLKKDFEQAKSQAAEFASSMKSLIGTLGVGLSIAGLGESIKELVEWEHSMSDAAAATGMTVQQISGFSFALKSTGVPLQELQLGMAQFDKIISGLMRSKAGATAIQAMGLSIAHLRSVGAHEALLEVADAFKKIPDGSAKAGAAAALFTATLGQKLIPILDKGRAGVLALEDQANKLGVSLTDNEAQAADQAYMAFIQLGAAMRGLEVEAGSHLFPALIQISEGLLGNTNALASFRDGLEETGLEMAKLFTYANPMTMLSGGALRKRITEEINDIETKRELSINAMTNQLKALTIPGVGSGATPMHLPDIYGLNGAKAKIDKVADAIKQLKGELLGLEQGDQAKALAHLKDIGASPAQMAQARALMNQIAAIKQTKASQKELADADRDYDRIVDSLSDSILKLNDAQKEYIKTVAQLNMLEFKGIDVTEGLTLAREQYAQVLLGNFKTPGQMGIKAPKGAAPGADILGENSMAVPSLTLMQKMQPQAEKLGRTLSSGFEGMIVSGKGFNQMLMRMTTLFGEFLMKAIVFKELANVFGAAGGASGGASKSGGATGGSGIGGVLGSLFSGLAGSAVSGKLASGGPVTAGQLYMVGESGPELFAPGASGQIIPNGGSGSGTKSSTQNVNIDARGADAGVEQRIYRAMAQMQKQVMGQALVVNYEYQARGGIL